MKTHQKGMTVVEVIVSFTIVSLSVAIGMMGIASGARLLNSGASLKHERSEAVAKLGEASGSVATVVIDGSSQNVQEYVVTDTDGNPIFKQYRSS